MRRSWHRRTLSKRGEMKRVPLPQDPMERSELLRDEFAGLWIAVWNDEIIAVGDSSDQVFARIDAQGLAEATVVRIPNPELGLAVGLG
jgi:hypothetical protein